MNEREHFSDLQFRPVKLPEGCAYRPVGLALGNGSSPLEVVVATADAEPRLPNVRSTWKERNRGRAAPLMLVVLHGDKATVCGPGGDDPPAYPNVDIGQAERICREALEQPDRHAALRCLRDALPSVESLLPGIRNEGFLATHELVRGVPRLADWEGAGRKARQVLSRRGEDLLRSLGFKIEPCDQVTSILRAGTNGKKAAVAVLLNQNESPELQADRFGKLSPVSYALAVADRENLPYVVVLQGSKLRLYPVKVGVGVGRRGRTETYVEVHTGLLRDADAGYLWLLFSAEALVEGGTLEKLLDESRRFAGELAERLRERIYGEVIPRLAQGLAEARGLRKPTAKDLAETYEMAMTVLFRLLFIAYAEDKDLLPYRWNGLYRARSLKTKATELLEVMRNTAGGPPAADATRLDDGTAHWEEVRRLFKAVEKGNREWGVPEYDGGLFSSDPDDSRIGALLAGVMLPDHVMGEVLKGLLLIQTPEGWGPVDFRSLGVREFGTVYEGLLESELSIAETDLTVDKEGYYRPAKKSEEVVVKQRRIYLHDRSGARKSTGTYFTKEFAVEHLLNHALEPALCDHLMRLDKLDAAAAAEAFFDFRVADIAMGSAHFLVSAVDHIERALTLYLARRSLPGVRAELAKLRASALEALGPLADTIGDEIEDTQLLRRLIARRCIYGVDINPVSVHLARLSIWIHTFVPGLPLSLLDHNLVVGNSLVGVGQLREIEEKASEDNVADEDAKQMMMYGLDAQALVGEALEPLHRLARIADATAAEVRRARKAMLEARGAVKPAEALCDITSACRTEGTRLLIDLERWDSVKQSLFGSQEHQQAIATICGLSAFHFPIAFPEVFLRDPAGFDVLVGNPPWEKVRVEEHEFWGRHFPGLRGLSKADRDSSIASLRKERPDLILGWERERAESEVLRNAVRDLPGMNTGHPDLFRAFMWRFIELVRPGSGRVGFVLPGDAFKIAGASKLRELLATTCSSVRVQMLTNKGEWVFANVDPRKLIAFVMASARGVDSATTYVVPPEVHDRIVWDRRDHSDAAAIPLDTLREYSSTLVMPLLPVTRSFEVVTRFMRSPQMLGRQALQVRRVYADFETSKHDRQYWHTERERGDWAVYAGESFDLWTPDTGSYYAYTDTKTILNAAHLKRQRAPRGSPYAETPKAWRQKIGTHPVNFPRIAFRDVTNRTNSRTLVVALVPPHVVTVQTAPWVLWLDPDHAASDEAYLLGVMSSIPTDWWTRRFVEGHVDQEAFNCLRIPDPRPHPNLYEHVVKLGGRLGAPDKRFASWAKSVGVVCGPLSDDEKYDHMCELDAVVTHLYGLDEKHLVHIFETFHEGWGPGKTADHPTLGDYDLRLKTTMGHYRKWARRR